MAETLYSLIENDLPEGKQNLLAFSSNVDNIATFCQENFDKAHSKNKALEDTKNYVAQTLSNLASQINFMATNFNQLIDIQTLLIKEMECNVNHISQRVNIIKEKIYRREIGVITANKETNRHYKVMAPFQPEQNEKYIRKPIDYSILDGIGNGIGKQIKEDNIPEPRIKARVMRNQTTGSISNSDSNKSPLDLSLNPHYFDDLSPISASHYKNNFKNLYSINASSGNIEPNPYNPNYMNHSVGFINNNMPTPLSYNSVPYRNEKIPGDIFKSHLSSPYTYDLSPNYMNFNMANKPGHMFQNGHNFDEDILDFRGRNSRNIEHTMYYDNNAHPHQKSVMSSMYHHHNNIEPINNYGMLQPPPPLNLYEALPRTKTMIPETFIEKVVALYNYECEKEDELSFKENSVIYVIKKNPDGWWEGVLDGKTGLFPGNYVEPCF